MHRWQTTCVIKCELDSWVLPNIVLYVSSSLSLSLSVFVCVCVCVRVCMCEKSYADKKIFGIPSGNLVNVVRCRRGHSKHVKPRNRRLMTRKTKSLQTCGWWLMSPIHILETDIETESKGIRCLWVYVCVREREREREGVQVCVCVCVCVRLQLFLKK